MSHADVSAALVEAVKRITGESEALVTVTNEGADLDKLCSNIDAAVGKSAALVFTDMAGGSCLQAAVRKLHGRANVAVVTGVNLPMLIDFVYHRDAAPRDAAARAVTAGSRGIQTVDL